MRSARLILGVQQSNQIEKDTEIDQDVERVRHVEEVVEVGSVVPFQPACGSMLETIGDHVRGDPHAQPEQWTQPTPQSEQ